MDKHIFNEQTGISYTLCGDYYLPELRLPVQGEDRPIGRYGRLHKQFLLEKHRACFDTLLASGKLDTYLADINELSNEQIDQLCRQMARQQGITEEFKAWDQLAWVGHMNSIRHTAEEIVLQEVVYHV